MKKSFKVNNPTKDESRTHLEKVRAHAAEVKAARAPFNGPIGTLTPDGVFFGRYRPKDRNTDSLGKTFNAFAAPQDLTNVSGKVATFLYDSAVKRLGELKNWHGFDGGKYANDAEIYAALKAGTYKGEWIIPPAALLAPYDADAETQGDKLYTHKDKGCLKDTFGTAEDNGRNNPLCYWTSTTSKDINVWVTSFENGNPGWWNGKTFLLSCRPVRLVEINEP